MSKNKAKDKAIELEELLKTSQHQTRVSNIIPVEIVITQQAMAKAEKYGPLVEEIGRYACEWYGFIIGNKDDKQNIVRDLVLAKDQDVSSAYVRVTGVNVAKTTKEVEEINKRKRKKYHILGWIHNHADFETFHSSTDDNNIYTVLNSVSLNTEKPVKKPLQLIESDIEQKLLADKIVINGQNEEDAVIEYLLRDEKAALNLLKKYGIKPDGKDPKKKALALLNDLIKASSFQVQETRMIGFCYSIVVNNRGSEPYGEIAVLEEDVISGRKKRYKKKVPVKVIEVPDDIIFTDEELRQEIKENIDFPNWWQRTFGFRGGYAWQTGYREYSYDRHDYNDLVRGPIHPLSTSTRKSRIASHSVSSGKQKKKKKGKKRTLKELTHVFVIKAREYLAEYRYTDCQYSKFMDKVLSNILMNEYGLEKAVEKAGHLKPDEYAEKPELEQRISEVIARNIYKDLKKNKDEKILGFMTDFVNSDTKEQNAVLTKYVPILKGVNPVVCNFADKIVEYADTFKEDYKYRVWTAQVLNTLQKNNNLSLEQAILAVGKVRLRDEVDYKGESTILSDLAKPKIKNRIYAGRYDSATLEFMKSFINPRTREQALYSYVNKLISSHKKQESNELDDLLKKHKRTKIKGGEVKNE